MTKNELRMLVEQKVNEAWYNNSDDFFKGVGKVTTAGLLGTAALTGGAYCLDKGLENQERYEQHLNQEAAKNMYGSDYHYKQWCQEHELDPNSQKAQQFYEGWVEDQMNESKIRHMVRRAIVENIVRKNLTEEIDGTPSTLIFQSIIEDHQAEEIAEDMGLDSADEAAFKWFDEVTDEGEWEPETIPKYSRFIEHSGNGNFDLYYDYGAGYYFAVRE